MFRNITDAGVFTVLLGFQIGFIGLMADVMVRRDRWSK
jgi:hypothetical protein